MRNDRWQCRSVLLALVLGGTSLNTSAMDGYTPPFTYQNIVHTFTVKKDGSYVAVNEATRRIETEEGASSNGEIDIAYIPKLESVEIQDAYTILPNGKHIKVPKKNIRTTNDELDKGGSSYSDAKHKIIIYPNVVSGSWLYYKYRKAVHTPVFPGQFEETKFVSPHLKYENYEVNFNFDHGIEIKIDSKGFTGGKLADNNGMQRYRFTFKQEMFLPPEPDQIDVEDFAPFVQATTYTNYEAFGSAYQRKAKPKARVTPVIQKLANELTAGVDDRNRQARILYNWVAKNIRYVASYIGNGGFVPNDSQTILDNKWGDCKDHVVMLEALLAAKGIASSPALINAEKSYVLPRLTADVFNHVITYVPELNLYLDSTSRFAPFGVLPESDLDKQVILTGLNRMGKTPPMRAREQNVYSLVTLKILPDGRIQGTSQNTSSGDAEISYRNLRFMSRNQPQEQITNAILREENLTGVGQLSSSDPTDLDKPLQVNSTFMLDPVSNFPGPAGIFIPAGLSLGILNGKMIPKPKLKSNFPERCESFSYTNHFEIEFPVTVKIKNIPENVSYKDEATNYTATYILKGNTLAISRELVVQHSTMVCGEAENEMDKKFFPVFQRDMLAQVIYE